MIDVDWSAVAADTLIVLEPVLVAVATAFVGMAFAWAREHWKALKASQAFAALEEAVVAEVTEAGTTYVNRLKEDGRWGPGEAKAIKSDVIESVLSRLPDHAKAILTALLGDLAAVIGSKIEQQVAANQASGVQAKLGDLADPTSPSQSSNATA